MKKLLIILLMLINSAIQAATYYVSSTDGSDSDSGLTEALAWQTLTKVNASIFVAGDQILFKRGDEWYGTLVIDQSGTLASPIIFGAYGTGTNPIITGFTSVTAWTDLGSNIWESTSAVSSLTTCNMVSINGVNTEMGRYPNADIANGGFLTIASHPTTTSLTCSALTGIPDWTGAQIVIRENDWTFSKRTVTSQSGTTVNYDTSCGAPTNYGFFFQNDSRTLDQQNEWYFNPTTKKIQVYSTSQPTNVKVSTVDNLIKFDYSPGSNYSLTSYVTIDGIDVSGSNGYAVWGFRSLATGHTLNGVNILNCNLTFNSIYAIYFKANTVKIKNCTINNSNGGAIDIAYSTDVIIRNNTIQNTGLFAGMDVKFSTIQIGGGSDTILVEYNKIINSGHNGITFGSEATTIRNNFFDTFNTVLDDGGGIYGGSNAVITNNILINGIGAWKGTSRTSGGSVCGIYLDDNATQNTVSYNTISSCDWIGIYLHNANNNTVNYNVSYNNGYQIRTADDGFGGDVISNAIQHNQFISKSTTQKVSEFVSNQNNILTIGTFDYNYYTRPIDDNLVFNIYQPSLGSLSYTLAQWKTFSSQDANSNKSPKTITLESELAFIYNTDSIAQTITVPYAGIDMVGNQYSTSIVLQPYTSKVLIENEGTPNYPTVTSASVSPTQVNNSGQVTFIATASEGTIRWWTAASGGTLVTNLSPTITQSTTYYAEAVSTLGYASLTRTAVTATVLSTGRNAFKVGGKTWRIGGKNWGI